MTKPEGWQWLHQAGKWHYFRDGLSLCRRWVYLSTDFVSGADISDHQKCKLCNKKLEKEPKSETGWKRQNLRSG